MFFILFVAAIFIAGCTNIQNPSGKPEADVGNENNAAMAFKTIFTGGLEAGDVAVELTPKGIEDSRLSVVILINTHTVELSPYDLMQITALEYGGKSIRPSSAPKLSGHHGSGTLIFDAGNDFDINNFRIKINGIPKVDERIFEWEKK